MSQLSFGEISAVLPEEWTVQGMLTLNLPSTDKNVKPNVIVTKEYLPTEVDLNDYFERIKQSIQKRGIRDLKISDERDIALSGIRGKMMVCSWDVSAMMESMKQKGQQQELPANIKPGQLVKQIQVTLVKEKMAINMTASFPDERFAEYYKPFQEFLKSLKIV